MQGNQPLLAEIQIKKAFSQFSIKMASSFEAIEDENLWDDEIHHDNMNANQNSDLDREWNTRHNQFHTTGYREGLLAGKDSSVQVGFNNGFKESVLVGYNWGLVRGITSSFAFLPEHMKEKLVEANEGRTKLEALHHKVHSVSGKDALKLFHKDSLKGKLETSSSNSEENSQVNLEGINQIPESAERIESPSNINNTSELAEFHRQLVSIIETTSINTACSSY
ncbi:uncharacterized protein LOC131050385 isoform X2 [Cryptomeria japonica]|uniref:uncharacterized protein LOC131050385 isoform X2 n=1 Tax=Cryptomeria japonica TaxID=3369 RepID=UPI0027DA85B7|nr:uncharacterized protein LOC131050385 isoform X2 [Cryptomeria japonica]